MRAFLRLFVANLGRRAIEWAEGPLPNGELLVSRVRETWDQESLALAKARWFINRVQRFKRTYGVRMVVSER